MSATLKRNPKFYVSAPLSVSGKNLLKNQTIQNHSRLPHINSDNLPKFEVNQFDYLNLGSFDQKGMSFIRDVLQKNQSDTKISYAPENTREKASRIYYDGELSEFTPSPIQAFKLPKSISFMLKNRRLNNRRKVEGSNAKIYNPKPTTKLLQLSNGIELTKLKKVYKYFIGSGNNDSLVSRTMHSKKGWIKVLNYQDANFIWTQLRKNKVMELIPTESEVIERSIKLAYTQSEIFIEEPFAGMTPLDNFDSMKIKVYNKLEMNKELTSKKRLLKNMERYYSLKRKDAFEYLPLTFHITKGSNDPNFESFKRKYEEINQQIALTNDKNLRNVWLVKPGELTNRGNGISICSTVAEVASRIDSTEYSNRTYLIQKYIYRPLLYQNRKFDIRCYILLTCYNHNLQAFFYKDGYLRTSATEFSLDNTSNLYIHLTNDAIQKKSENYGLFECSNKLSYSEFQDYLNENHENKADFVEDILPKIKELVKDTVRATFQKLNRKGRLFTFEILGYDFMLDEFFKPWLIEINTNPCLELSGTYLAEVIPNMLRNAFHIALDQLFPMDFTEIEKNGFRMIFNQSTYYN